MMHGGEAWCSGCVPHMLPCAYKHGLHVWASIMAVHTGMPAVNRSAAHAIDGKLAPAEGVAFPLPRSEATDSAVVAAGQLQGMELGPAGASVDDLPGPPGQAASSAVLRMGMRVMAHVVTWIAHNLPGGLHWLAPACNPLALPMVVHGHAGIVAHVLHGP